MCLSQMLSPVQNPSHLDLCPPLLLVGKLFLFIGARGDVQVVLQECFNMHAHSHSFLIILLSA